MTESQKSTGLVPNSPQTLTGQSQGSQDTSGMNKPESAFGFEGAQTKSVDVDAFDAPPNTKPWYRSWTVWFNVIALAFTAAEAAVPVLRPVLGERLYAITLAVVIAGNLILRAKTVQGIVFRQPQ